jgi:AraC-like DNA-binding protein
MASTVSSPASPWGAIGEPRAGPGVARLLHVLRTEVATLRHAILDRVTIPPHEHDETAILYVFGGPIVDAVTGAPTFPFRLIYEPFGRGESLCFEGPAHILSVEIPVGSGRGDLLAWSAQSVPMPAPLYNDIWKVLVAVATGAKPEAVNAFLTDFLKQALLFAAKPMPVWLYDALREAHSNWQSTPDVDALASRCGLSVQHFYRAWKKHLGVTPGTYSLILRLDHARGLIWATDMSISQIALETGFSDQSHLTRTLAAYTGVPPVKLRSAAPCLPRGFFSPSPSRQS